MNTQTAKAEQFRSLHIKSHPVILTNIWDAGSAMAVARGGAVAIATSSWSVAAARGYGDGEEMPLDEALAVISRIVECADLPVTVDFEGGYSAEPASVRKNVSRLLDNGVIGLNFEDQVMDGPGLYAIDEQAHRLRAVRSAAEQTGIPAFINARTDEFLKAAPGVDHGSLLDEAIARATAYAAAGADGFFVPGLEDKSLIRKICEQTTLPVNVMIAGDAREISEIASLGVARISFGPAPYINAINTLESQARAFA